MLFAGARPAMTPRARSFRSAQRLPGPRVGRQDEDFGRQFQSAACRSHCRVSRRADDRLPRAPLRRSRDLRGNPRERARPRRLHHPVDVLSGERQSDGVAYHDRRAQARVGASHHGGPALFRLRAAGPEAGPAFADLGQARRQSHHPGGRGPRAHGRSARRPDPGLLRHPDRQSLRRPDHGAGHQVPQRRRQERDGRVAGRRRRGAGARARQAPRRAARHRRQTSRAGGRIRKS